MSQQMFEPQESQQSQQQGWRAYDHPRRDRKTREMPKNEHPSTFEEPFATIDASGSQEQYMAENVLDTDAEENISYQSGYTGNAVGTDQPSYSSNGESMEYDYRPYNAYQPSQTATSMGVPSWARPQRNPVFRSLAKVLVILLIAALVLKVIIPLLVLLFAIAAIIVFIAVVGLLVFGVFLLGILRLLGVRVPLRPTRFLRKHWRRQGRWRHIYFHL